MNSFGHCVLIKELFDFADHYKVSFSSDDKQHHACA